MMISFRVLAIGLFAAGFALTQAQFVWPKPEYNRPEPGVYEEDPFIVQYRKEFFAVFRGDFARFERAFLEIEAMVAKDPEDARARVWLGNGQMVHAGLKLLSDREEARRLLGESSRNLDHAVRLRPDDPNIYMMRAATLYLYGQYFPSDWLDRSVWERLRDDCLKFIDFVGPDRLSRVSIHVRGEAFGSLGIAYVRLGERDKARHAFTRVIELCPGTTYEERARREIEALKDPS